MTGEGEYRSLEHCYDFPEVVLHRPGCARYNRGVCRPFPTPRPPYSEEEAAAVAMYEDITGGLKETQLLSRVVATGSTLLPPGDAEA